MTDTNEKLVSVYNKGGRVFRTSRGPLGPEGKLALPPEEAKSLLCYPEVIETGKMTARDNRTVVQLREENARLRAELDDLKKSKAGAKAGDKEPGK